jgi:hypothetical protein
VCRRRRRQLAIFCLDLVTAITYLNQERIIFLWYRARARVISRQKQQQLRRRRRRRHGCAHLRFRD